MDKTRSPLWLRLLGGVVLALAAVGMLHAVAIAVSRYSQIGV